jgi:hypothetical protein
MSRPVSTHHRIAAIAVAALVAAGGVGVRAVPAAGHGGGTATPAAPAAQGAPATRVLASGDPDGLPWG